MDGASMKLNEMKNSTHCPIENTFTIITFPLLTCYVVILRKSLDRNIAR